MLRLDWFTEYPSVSSWRVFLPLLQTFLGLFEQRQLAAMKGKTTLSMSCLLSRWKLAWMKTIHKTWSSPIFPHSRHAEQQYFAPLQCTLIHTAPSQCLQGEDLYMQATISGSVLMCSWKCSFSENRNHQNITTYKFKIREKKSLHTTITEIKLSKPLPWF